MNNPGSQNPANAGEISAMGEKAMNQCPCQMPRGRVNHQPGRLIQDDQGGIFMDESEPYSFRLQMVWPSRRNRDAHFVRQLEPITWLDGSVVNLDSPVPDQFLNSRTGENLNLERKKGIDPLISALLADKEKEKPIRWLFHSWKRTWSKQRFCPDLFLSALLSLS
jgi:hypothetical protein